MKKLIYAIWGALYVESVIIGSLCSLLYQFQIFEFITGRFLFRHESFKDSKTDITLDERAYHLCQMTCFIGEDDFPPAVLQYSRLASKNFNTDLQ